MNRVATLSCKWRFLQASGFSLVLTAALCAGCGSNKGLTRSKAAEMIRNSKLLSGKAETVELHTGGTIEVSQGSTEYLTVGALEKLGYARIEAGGRSSWGTELYVFSLSAKGESASKEWNKPGNLGYWIVYTIPVATQEFVEVTGVSGGAPESHPGDMASVEYSWKWVLAPIGRELEQAGVKYLWSGGPRSITFEDLRATRSGAAKFVLYDDGWRLKE